MFADLRYALRLLAQAPGFTLVAILTLSIGIGSATIVFSGVNALLFKPMPHVTPERHARLVDVHQSALAHDYQRFELNYRDFLDLRAQATSLEGLWAYSHRTVILQGGSEPERLLGHEISWDAFHHLGVPPLLGRLFTAADDDKVALISHDLWQRRFGGDPEVVGTKVQLNDEPVLLIGVMPAQWRYPTISDLWTPLHYTGQKAEQRGSYHLTGQGLLKAGVSLAQAQVEIDTIMRTLAQEFPATNASIGAVLTPAREGGDAQGAQLIGLLFGAVMFVFLIACVNVANLTLARAVTRTKEFALRLALGAERYRLLRQLVIESLVLAFAGAIGGLLVTLWGVDAMCALVPVPIPFWLQFGPDGRVFLFVTGLAVLAAVIFGLLPAARATRPDLVTELKEGGRGSDDASHRGARLRHTLVIAEIALALVLLVGAGLMMRSFLHLRSEDPGFNAEGVLTFRVGFPPVMAEKDQAATAAFFAQLPRRLATIPGVESAGLVTTLPGTSGNMAPLEIEGRPTPKSNAEALHAAHREVSADYFETVQIPRLRGRVFSASVDRKDTPPVALVDARFARNHFGGLDEALGKRVRIFDPGETMKDKNPWVEIVGVVGDIRHGLINEQVFPTVYSFTAQHEPNFLSAVVRTTGDPASYVAAVRAEVLALHPGIPIYYELTLEHVLLQTIWPRMFFSVLFTVFGLVALFLACIGIYGVMAYSVTQRTQEIGVRMALGAQPREVIRFVVRRGLALVGWGLGSGMVAAALLANLLAGVLYGVSPHDPPTFAAVPLLLAVVALLACYLPSRRAVRLDPLVALRGE